MMTHPLHVAGNLPIKTLIGIICLCMYMYFVRQIYSVCNGTL